MWEWKLPKNARTQCQLYNLKLLILFLVLSHHANEPRGEVKSVSTDFKKLPDALREKSHFALLWQYAAVLFCTCSAAQANYHGYQYS